MKSKDLKSKQDSELIKDLENLRRTLGESRSNTSGSKARNVKEVRELRKEIARILTELNSRKA